MWVKVASHTFSGVSIASLDNCFSAAYDYYMITRNFTGSSAGARVNLRLRSGGTATSTSNYQYSSFYGSGSSALSSTYANQSTAVEGFGYIAGDSNMCITFIDYPFISSYTGLFSINSSSYGSTTIDLGIETNTWNTTASFDGVEAVPTSGTISGKFTVYGLKESL